MVGSDGSLTSGAGVVFGAAEPASCVGVELSAVIEAGAVSAAVERPWLLSISVVAAESSLAVVAAAEWEMVLSCPKHVENVASSQEVNG